MMLLRRARHTDLTDIFELAQHSGIGLTTLPKDIDALEIRLSLSTASFKSKVKKPGHEYYLFVLEDPTSKKVIGTSAIMAMNGYDKPVYYYQVMQHFSESPHIQTRIGYETLNFVENVNRCSEICTLYLEPNYRRNQNGVLLSRSRFLYMAHYPERFTEKITAEMRGIADSEGHSPFWDAIGNHFFKMSFEQADRLSSNNKQFITDLMPRNPLYITLLPIEAQVVIGKPHHLTAPAMNILIQEGFHYNHFVDIFDAGPTIEATRDNIKTISNSCTKTVKNIVKEVSGTRFLAANPAPNFRASIAFIDTSDTSMEVNIDQETAALLTLKCGDSIKIAPL